MTHPNHGLNDPSNTSQPATGPADAPAHLSPDQRPAEHFDPAHQHAPNIKPREEVFDESCTFATMGLRNSVLKGIEEAGFKHPTKTQSMLIPAILAGKDVLGQAKTGSGKTAAFGLPLLHRCDRDVPFQAIILAPTRELAIQITQEIDDLGKHTPIRATTVYGGQAVRTQATKLQKGAPIIVGTPGRVMDMLERGLLHFRNIKFAVLDEVDRMLDIGFREDIRKILDQTPKERQTVFVSATISPDIEKLARKYMRDPEKIIVHGGSLTVSLVEQHYLAVNQWDKRKLLIHLLKHEEPALTIIFCRLKKSVDDLADAITRAGIEAHAIHGDMPQGKRNRTMEQLRAGKLSVLIASDLASRGIDVEGISHVINYDLPEDPEVYVHRIGRTARAGRGGVAWSFVTPEQGELLTSIEILINAEIPRLDYPDFVPTERPGHWRDDPKGGRREGGLQIADAPGAPPPAPKPVNRIAATVNLELPPQGATVDPTKFPGGIVPTKMPPKRLMRGIRSNRH